MICIKNKNLRDIVLSGFFVPVVIGLMFFGLYLALQTTSIYGGDSGELVSVAYTVGIAHPPGYPLYTMIGAIVSHIPFSGSVAWRVGLLSSITMALSVFMVWCIVFRLTKTIAASTLSAVFYGFLYPVWLYAITPEVFGMYALFSGLFVYVFIGWIEDRDIRTLGLLAFMSGLSLTHHHLIIVAIAAAGFTMYRYFGKSFIAVGTYATRFVLLFFLGFMPYLYAPIASFFHPIFDREHADTLAGFVRLVTRASYGTFRASGTGTGGILNGIFDLTTFGQYVFHDMTIVGIVFACAGLYYLRVKDKRIFSFVGMYLALLLFYFFYAGFPVANNFQLGTLERFFIVPYQMIAILIGVGVAYFCNKLFLVTGRRVVGIMVYALVFLIPLGACVRNYPQFARLVKDRTFERYTDDIFSSIPQGAIYGVYQDTTASSMDYAYYVQGKRSDVMYLNFYLLNRSYYRELLHRYYPSLIFPEWTVKTTLNEYLAAFLSVNSKKFSITSDVSFSSVSGYFVPSGLVYMYYPTLSDIPDRSLMLDKNDRLWKRFSDPLSGALQGYKHLFLSDVLRLYADHAIALSLSQALSGNYQQAQKYVTYALAHETTMRIEEYSPLFDSLMERRQCSFARDFVDREHAVWRNDFVILEQYHRLFTTCYPVDPQIQAKELLYQKFKPVYDTQIR